MKAVNMNQLAVMVSKKEGKKKQTSIAQIKEILKVTSGIVAKNPMALVALLKNGCKAR